MCVCVCVCVCVVCARCVVSCVCSTFRLFLGNLDPLEQFGFAARCDLGTGIAVQVGGRRVMGLDTFGHFGICRKCNIMQ